jgi:hypothetical protein
MRIEDVLARRSDLSTFLVHLTRVFDGVAAKTRLIKILKAGRILAKTPMGQAVKPLETAGKPTDSQKVVCFTETPLEHVCLLLGQIEGRACVFEPYGLAMTKRVGRRMGVNPVWYLDITPGHDWLTVPANDLIDRAIRSGNFLDHPVAKLAPFIEQMGSGTSASGDPYRKEFWWEREWRHVGHFDIPSSLVVLCPEEEISEFKSFVDDLPGDLHASFVDPNWSLEQMIARLAGFSMDDVGLC